MNTLLIAYTVFHVLISLVGIAAGFWVLYGMLSARYLDEWTALFLITTIATSVTGFFFPVHHFMPSHGVGILSMLVLPVAIFARYRQHLVGAWRWIFVVSAMLAFYLNFFVLIVQLFAKVPALKALAPTQSEPPFAITQLVFLLAFIVLTVFAVRRFRPEPRVVAALQTS